MVFKNRKIPSHLIIQEEYEIRRRPRFGLLKVFILGVLLISLTYIYSIGVIQGLLSH